MPENDPTSAIGGIHIAEIEKGRSVRCTQRAMPSCPHRARYTPTAARYTKLNGSVLIYVSGSPESTMTYPIVSSNENLGCVYASTEFLRVTYCVVPRT